MIILRGVKAGYGKRLVLKGVDLEVDGGFVALLGPNGSGKTTLLKVISGILRPFDGCVSVMGRSVDGWGRKEISKLLTLVSQDFYPIYDFTVRELVSLGRVPRMGFFPSGEDLRVVEEVLEKVGLRKLENRRFSQLSSGQKRLVMLARALAQEVKMILVDELELHLDPFYKAFMARILKDFVEGGGVVISVFHDIELALSFADRVVGIKDGRVVFDVESWGAEMGRRLYELYGVEFVEGRGGVFHPWYH